MVIFICGAPKSDADIDWDDFSQEKLSFSTIDGVHYGGPVDSFTACNKDIKFNPALTPPVGAVNPDNHKMFIGFSKTREGLKHVWENDARKLSEPEDVF